MIYVLLLTSIFITTTCSYREKIDDGLIIFACQYDNDNEENYQNQNYDSLEPGIYQSVEKDNVLM